MRFNLLFSSVLITLFALGFARVADDSKDKNEQHELDTKKDLLLNEDYYEDYYEDDDYDGSGDDLEENVDDEDLAYEDGSGSFGDDDEDYEDEDYDDDEDVYDDDDDDDEEEEDNGFEDKLIDEIKKIQQGKDEDLHFDEEGESKTKLDDLLYEYENEIYEDEDYDVNKMSGDSHMTTSSTEKVPSSTETEAVLTSSHIWLLASSALISFFLMTLAFLLCYMQRKKSQQYKKKNMPFVVDSTFLGVGNPTKTTVIKPSAPSPSSIVKSYHRVPSSTKEFLSTSASSSTTSCSMENQNWERRENEKPLLP